MKIQQLVETENVKNANRTLKNLLERSRTEVVGLGLFYGRAGFGKSRWAIKAAQNNGYVYMRLDSCVTPKVFISKLLSKLPYKTMPLYEVKRFVDTIYGQVLDILQRDMNITIVLDEIDYAFSKQKVLTLVRYLADESLDIFVLVGMEKSKEKLLKMDAHYFDRCACSYEFKPLNHRYAELIITELCDIKVDEEIVKYVHSKCNGTMRILNKYIDVLERIGKRMKKTELAFGEIKDIITRLED